MAPIEPCKSRFGWRHFASFAPLLELESTNAREHCFRSNQRRACQANRDPEWPSEAPQDAPRLGAHSLRARERENRGHDETPQSHDQRSRLRLASRAVGARRSDRRAHGGQKSAVVSDNSEVADCRGKTAALAESDRE